MKHFEVTVLLTVLIFAFKQLIVDVRNLYQVALLRGDLPATAAAYAAYIKAVNVCLMYCVAFWVAKVIE
jgi:hypothetical protein